MPLYRFNCKKCGNPFEVFLRPSEANQKIPCPHCGCGEVERVEDAEREGPTSGVCGTKPDR